MTNAALSRQWYETNVKGAQSADIEVGQPGISVITFTKPCGASTRVSARDMFGHMAQIETLPLDERPYPREMKRVETELDSWVRAATYAAGHNHQATPTRLNCRF